MDETKKELPKVLRKLKKSWPKILIIFGAVLLALVVVLRLSGALKPGGKTIITSATLTDTVAISELSTSQFTYNGIAEVYDEDKPDKLLCHVRYHSTVKAGIDFSEVTFEIDHENQTVRPILPEISILVNAVDEDALSFMPDDATVPLQDALAACKEDAATEAAQAEVLYELAEENLQSIIEALLYPVLETEGYSIIWEDSTEVSSNG